MAKHERIAGKFALGAAFGSAFIGVVGMTGCISDTDCGICDPDKLVLESISGINYSNRKVNRLTEGVSEGKYFIEDIGACVETEDATEAERGPEEWCKLSPLVTWQGLEFVFNNLLDPTSIELVRKDPSNPQLFQIYDWKPKIAKIEGPITRFNGDYVEQTGEEPDLSMRSINLTCIDNLRAQGMDFSHEVLDDNPDICLGFRDDGLPRKMQPDGEIKSYGGETDWRGSSCSAPDSGPDTCCTVCDYELSVNVAKYGVESGVPRTPANAISCTPGGNVYADCANFVTSVNREAETNRYAYEWDGVMDTWRVPMSDKIRETHPDQRPNGVEPDGLPCQSSADCDAGLGSDSGAVCVGELPDGTACTSGTAECENRHCKAEWFVGCKDDTGNTGGSWCVDRRFKDKGAGACYIAESDFQSCEPGGSCTTYGAGNRLARCDTGEFPDGNLAANECCQVALGAEQDGAGCDPLFQDGVSPTPRFDRDRTLPEETRECFCGDPANQHPDCTSQIENLCTAPWGNLDRHDGESNEGHYITRFVSKVGGVIYDPALKGILYLPGDRGNQPRSTVENCAELATSPDLIGGRNTQDGWRMHDNAFFETYENFDRGMCSGSEYHVVFADEGQQVEDKVGNTLDTLSYEFHTPEFHVVPGTGFPTDNLRVGACDDFEISLSNKYDLDPKNLQKIELVQLGRISGEDSFGEDCSTSLQPECFTEGHVVAGGAGCVEDANDITEDNPPCLTVDVSLQREGLVRVLIDSVKYPIQLFNFDPNDPSATDAFGRTISGRYRMRIPGLDGVERFEDLKLGFDGDPPNPDHVDAYEAAFHDVCGMPLITGGGQNYTDFIYDFSIDKPKCKEDEDGDGVQLSCDNARDVYNPLQYDGDLDGFGDVVDLCQLTPSDTNTADSDKDGIGNDCDRCRETVDKYNLEMGLPTDAKMWVRNIPFQQDFDNDGIGDVCDNCVTVANCGDFNQSSPHTVGVPVPFEDAGVCQTDIESDMIGDLCIDPDTMMPYNATEAAGAVGFAETDDFDQDGIVNLEDNCPRQPVAASYDLRVACTDDAECPTNSLCAATPANDGNRYCNHADEDGDFVGDSCDTCPYAANPLQVTDSGMQSDDEDGDFVGAECETNESCLIRKDARPYAFMDVSVEGQCCVTSYPGDGEYMQAEDGSWDCIGLCDPDGFPITRDCADEADPEEDEPDGSKCRLLPAAVADLPGVVDLAPGCEDALATAGYCDGNDPNCADDMANQRLTIIDVPNEEELWSKMCFLPQWDQDFDGVGDACDLCPFAYDPFNEAYVDVDTGKLWDNIGKYCAGEYAPDAICAAEEAEEGGTETGETGG